MEELKRFENDLKNNDELRKNLDEALKRITEEGLAESDGEIMVMAAKELGYDFSISALEQARAETEELDMEELKQIAGGDQQVWCTAEYTCFFTYHQQHEDQDFHNQFCVATWHCFTAVVHTEGGTKKEACWQNYGCMLINKEDGEI